MVAVLPHAVVVSLRRKSAATLYAFPFATAWPVNAELAASSGSKPDFVARTSRFQVSRLNMSAWATRALASNSTSAQPADQLSTTSLRDWKNTWQSLLGHLLIQAFQRHASLFMSLECTAGSFPHLMPSTSHEQCARSVGSISSLPSLVAPTKCQRACSRAKFSNSTQLCSGVRRSPCSAMRPLSLRSILFVGKILLPTSSSSPRRRSAHHTSAPNPI